MLSLKDNIRAVLECHFSQCEEELIESATTNIHALFINKIMTIKNVVNAVEEDSVKNAINIEDVNYDFCVDCSLYDGNSGCKNPCIEKIWYDREQSRGCDDGK